MANPTNGWDVLHDLMIGLIGIGGSVVAGGFSLWASRTKFKEDRQQDWVRNRRPIIDKIASDFADEFKDVEDYLFYSMIVALPADNPRATKGLVEFARKRIEANSERAEMRSRVKTMALRAKFLHLNDLSAALERWQFLSSAASGRIRADPSVATFQVVLKEFEEQAHIVADLIGRASA